MEGEPIIKQDFENFEPKEKVLKDARKDGKSLPDGFWDLREKTWGGPQDRMLNNTMSAPDLTYDPNLKGRYKIIVGVRAVAGVTDFGLRLSSENTFSTISPPRATTALHYNLELLWKDDVSLDGEKIVIHNLGNAPIYIDHFKFIPLLKKEPRLITDSVVIYKEQGKHFGFPGVTQAENGDILVVSREGISHSEPGDYGKIVLIRSKDGGQTWEKPVTIQQKPNVDLRDPSILSLSDGTIVVTYTYYTVRSYDNGYTWDTPTLAPVFSPLGVTEAPDGTLYYCGLRLNDDGTLRFQGVSYVEIVKSLDKGKTWQDYSLVVMTRAYAEPMTWESYDEPSLGILPNGRWVVMYRVDLDGYLRESISNNYGNSKTWTWPKKTQIWGYPVDLLFLKDGSLLATYGYRKNPMGVRASLSYDGGETWDLQHEIIIREDLSGDLGYPQSIELADGRIFTVYYSSEQGGNYLAGSFYKVK